MIASRQGKVTSFATELEATNQKTETRCTNIRKEVSKALSEQRQLLTSQAEAMSKKMDSVSAKVFIRCTAHLSLCVVFPACLPARLFVYLSVCLPACLSISVCLSVHFSAPVAMHRTRTVNYYSHDMTSLLLHGSKHCFKPLQASNCTSTDVMHQICPLGLTVASVQSDQNAPS